MANGPSRNALKNRCNLFRYVSGQDEDAGAAAAYSLIAANVACSVQLQESVHLDAAEHPSKRHGMLNTYAILFGSPDLGMKLRDKIVWIDVSPNNVMFVDGRNDEAGRHSCYEYSASEVL